MSIGSILVVKKKTPEFAQPAQSSGEIEEVRLLRRGLDLKGSILGVGQVINC
jgi:hypothetical protein